MTTMKEVVGFLERLVVSHSKCCLGQCSIRGELAGAAASFKRELRKKKAKARSSDSSKGGK